MNLTNFRARIRELLRPSGYSQKMLAYALGVQPTALSNKLNGTGETSLKHTEARQIIKILAGWEVITTQAEAVELLDLLELKQGFSPEEWQTPPLNKLTPGLTSAVPSSPPDPTRPVLCGPVGGAAGPPHNLPAQPTAMVGRQQEITQICALLRRPTVRLATLTGTGGIGKTRLALSCSAALLPYFKDGVFFVALDPVSDPAQLLPAIARTLALKETGSRSLEALLSDYLAGRQLLLVLDNFEQVLAGKDQLGWLLADQPSLKILVTSRVLLRLYGEYEYVVPPLPIPGRANLTERPEALLDYEAVKLFCQRAQAAKVSFELTAENAPLVVEICRRLDGLPLALELAATRLKTMSLQAILARLDHRLELLNRGPTDLPLRQQTLRTLIDWSYDLLTIAEQTLLTNLSIFAGGCDSEAVWAICRGDAFSPEALQDRLADLVDKSMLRAVEDETEAGQTRFSMLDTLREYAAEKLTTSGEEERLRERHLAYFLELAKAGEAGSVTNQQNSWLARLEREQANFRVALAWALADAAPARIEAALRLGSCLAWFWDAHGHLSEGRHWLEQALDRWLADSVAEGLLQEGEGESGQVAGRIELRAKALNAAGNLARRQGDTTRAALLLEESLVLRRRLRQPREIAKTLNNLGVLIFNQGDLPRAEALYRESLAIKTELGEQYSSALTLNNLGELYYEQADYPTALAFFEQSRALLDRLGDVQSRAVVLLNLGSVAAEMADYERAAFLLRESLVSLNELGDKFHIAEALEGLALLAWRKTRIERAATLYGAAEALRAWIDAPLPPRRSRRNPFRTQANLPGGAGPAPDPDERDETTENLGVVNGFNRLAWREHWQAGGKRPLAEIVKMALDPD